MSKTRMRPPSTGSHRGPDSQKRPSGTLSLVIGLALLLVGLGVMLYPAFTDIEARGVANEAIDEMREELVEDAPAGTDEEGYRQKEGDPEYERLVEYNEAVRDGTGDAVNDPFAFPQEELDSFGLPDGILGSITIPALDIKIPLYLGASAENMVYGAGIVAGTSIPLGEETSNTVVAAHRGGYYGMPMFRNIEELEPGDQVIIETPWDKLVYRVTDFEVILPTDVEALALEEGRDMVTLFTCHPYGENAHRILVHCDYDPTAEAEVDPNPVLGAISSFIPTSWSSDSPLLNVENVLKLIGMLLVLLCAVLLMVRAVRQMRTRRRQRAARRDERGGYRRQAPPGSHFR